MLEKLSEAWDKLFNEHVRLEQRMLEIEQMDKDNLPLDDQFALIEEYNRLWERINELNKKLY